MAKKYLFIDSTLSGLAMGYWDGEQNFRPLVFADQLTSHGLLTRVYRELVKEGPVDHIVCGNGPGSFTGIRIGLAFAYGLVAASAKKTSICGISGLGLGFGQLIRDKEKADFVLWPSTRTHAYIASETQTALISVSDTSALEKMFQGKRVLSCLCPKPWAALAELKLPFVIEEKSLELDDLLAAILNGMKEICQNLSYYDSIPESNYLRLSTAEEKKSTNVKKEG